jgi:hypothetical protein
VQGFCKENCHFFAIFLEAHKNPKTPKEINNISLGVTQKKAATIQNVW